MSFSALRVMILNHRLGRAKSNLLFSVTLPLNLPQQHGAQYPLSSLDHMAIKEDSDRRKLLLPFTLFQVEGTP